MASGGWLGEDFGHWGVPIIPTPPPSRWLVVGGLDRTLAIGLQFIAELDQLSVTRACATPPPQVGEEGSG